MAYFEQCIKGAIDDTMNKEHFVVTYESIIPNLTSLRNYKPMLKEFWKEGLFESIDKRYFRLINCAPSLGDEINWDALDDYHPFEAFQEIFLAENVGQESYFDSMTHFDFKTLLPALLQIEDRVSMAHGLEVKSAIFRSFISRVSRHNPGQYQVYQWSDEAYFKGSHELLLAINCC